VPIFVEVTLIAVAGIRLTLVAGSSTEEPVKGQPTFRYAVVVVALICAGVALVVAIFWPFADLVARHDLSSIPRAQQGSQILAALDSARDQLFQVCAGVLAVLGFYYTARGFLLTREQSELNRQTLELSVQGQITERFSRAVEQIGSTKLEVRVGGIYALERLAADSAREYDKSVVVDVISAFLLSHAHSPAGATAHSSLPDVNAAITVIARRNPSEDIGKVSLPRIELNGLRLAAGACLANIDFTGAVLSGANLAGADFTNAILDDADLSGADLRGAILAGASLTGARLSDARLNGAQLPGADLSGAHLPSVPLIEANLSRAVLVGTELAGSDLTDADLSDANLADADLTGATLVRVKLKDARVHRARLIRVHLNGADLTGAVLADAQLAAADLAGAVCVRCDFSGAKPYDAKFEEADLSEVDLLGLHASGARLAGALISEDARLPPGCRRDPQTGKLVERSVDGPR